MSQNYEEKINSRIASYQKKLASIKKQKKELNNKTSQLRAKIKDAQQEYEIKRLQEIAPIAFAAQDVFQDNIPNDREKARIIFSNILSDALKWRQEHKEDNNEAEANSDDEASNNVSFDDPNGEKPENN